MKIKVTATMMLDTDKISPFNKDIKAAIEREILKGELSRLGRLWMFDEAEKQDRLDIKLEVL